MAWSALFALLPLAGPARADDWDDAADAYGDADSQAPAPPRRGPGQEDVLTLHDGTVLRGTIVDEGDASLRIRVAGGSVFVVLHEEIALREVAAPFARETAHGGRFGLRLGGGFDAGVSFSENVGTSSGLGSEVAFTWSPWSPLELEAGGVVGPAGVQAVVGVRWFHDPGAPLKPYSGLGLIVAGDEKARGLRLSNGFQWDFTRHFGVFLHHGAVGSVETAKDRVRLSYHLETGLQGRI